MWPEAEPSYPTCKHVNLEHLPLEVMTLLFRWTHRRACPSRALGLVVVAFYRHANKNISMTKYTEIGLLL
jgi:hypothetical protein